MIAKETKHFNKRSNRFDSKKRKKENPMAKKCPSCESEMRPRGASDCCGGLSWKCRNSKCGRTTWVFKLPITPPEPLTYEYFEPFFR